MYIVMHNTTVDQNNIHLHVVMKICHKHDKCTSKYWHYTWTCTWTSIKVDIPVHVVYSIQVKLFWNVDSIKCHVRIICRICSLQCSKLYTMSMTYTGESNVEGKKGWVGEYELSPLHLSGFCYVSMVIHTLLT